MNLEELGIKPRVDWPGAFRIKEADDGFYVDVVPMIVNDRIICTPLDQDGYTRFWCYDKGGAAILAALAWEASEDTEPVGWKKSWDGRRHGEEVHAQMGQGRRPARRDEVQPD